MFDIPIEEARDPISGLFCCLLESVLEDRAIV